MAELTAALNILSTITLIGALIFTGLQVRTANRVRAEQAALAIISSFQSVAWADAISELIRIPPGVTAAEIDALGPKITQAIQEHGIRIEAVGYMVFRGIVALETVEQLIGGATVIFWLRIKPWVERDRKQTSSPRQYEWVQWLAERLEEQHARSGAQPAYLEHASWKQSDARPAT